MRDAYGGTMWFETGVPGPVTTGTKLRQPSHAEWLLNAKEESSVAHNLAASSKTMNNGPRQATPRLLPRWKLRE